MDMDLSYTKDNIRRHPINYWDMGNGDVVAIYQGDRGGNPELDFVVKYKSITPKTRLRAPSHTHWIVDMIVKCESDNQWCQSFTEVMMSLYETTEPFKTIQERLDYQPMWFDGLDDELKEMNLGFFSVRMLTTLIELFTKCEKQTEGAFMFKDLLVLLNEYSKGDKDFYQVVSKSKRV